MISRKLACLGWMVLLVAVTGCAGPQALRSSYLDYANAYGEISNQQLLLNLARVRNVHPPYFLQVGSITAGFSFGGSLNLAHILTDPSGAADTRVTNLGLGLTRLENPTFSFTPLSGQSLADALLRPIDTKVFHLLFGQNISSDILLRMMMHRVDLVLSDRQTVPLFNIYNPRVADNYIDFLRFAALFWELQQRNLLRVEGEPDTGLRFVFADDAAAVIAALVREHPDLALKSLSGRNPKATLAEVRFQTRSFVGLLRAVAVEALSFDLMATHAPEILAQVPKHQREPLLRIEARPEYTEPATARVRYAGREYVISDPPGQFRNRLVFSLLQFFSTQIESDPGKLPVQQLINVN